VLSCGCGQRSGLRPVAARRNRVRRRREASASEADGRTAGFAVRITRFGLRRMTVAGCSRQAGQGSPPPARRYRAALRYPLHFWRSGRLVFLGASGLPIWSLARIAPCANSLCSSWFPITCSLRFRALRGGTGLACRFRGASRLRERVACVVPDKAVLTYRRLYVLYVGDPFWFPKGSSD